MANDYEHESIENTPLITYRLGRVEKSLDALHETLRIMETIQRDISLTQARVSSLETWRSALNKFVMGIALTVVGILIQIVLASNGKY